MTGQRNGNEGWNRPVRVTAGCRPDIGAGCAPMLRNGLLHPGIYFLSDVIDWEREQFDKPKCDRA